MSAQATESARIRAELDVLPAAEVVRLVLDSAERVAPAVREQAHAVAAGAEMLADRFAAGGRLVFVGAGTSGRVALAEAAELPGTFGIGRDRVVACLAGAGGDVGGLTRDADEDDLDAAAQDVAVVALTAADVVVAVAASGSTPYTLALAQAAKRAGSAVIAVVNVNASPLAALADVAIEIAPLDEVLRESTRMNAGTAQKLVLNALTTAAMARAGRVHGDLMVDVEPANAKLRDRAAAIVAEIAGCDAQAARDAVTACGSARAAVVHLVSGLAPDEARRVAAEHRSLREALASQSGNEANSG